MAGTEQRLRALLNEIAKVQNYEDYELTVSPISTGGANYSSLLYIATITSKNKEDLHLFIKVAAMSKELREQVATINFYETEKVVYTDLKTAYNELEIKHGVPEEHRLYLPKYYGATCTSLEEMLVLENMAIKGFATHDRFKSIDWEYASKAIIELAKLHSLSISFQAEYPETFKKIKDRYIVAFMNEHIVKNMWDGAVKSALGVLTEEHKRKFMKFAEIVDYDFMKKLYLPLKVNVILHRDYRPSNLMHRTLKDGSLEVVVVDHQTIEMGTPVTDLLYFIFNGTDKQFRDMYYDKLVEFYYTELNEAMKRLGIDPEKTYSKEDFYFELNEKLPIGLIVATYSLPFVTVETNDAPELTGDKKMKDFNITQTGALYPERMNDVIADFIKWGVLK